MSEEKIVKLEEYYKRDFLNPHGQGMAAFEASVKGDTHYVGGSFSITDCSRKISLDFDAWDFQDAKNGAAKLRMLITELQIFEEKLLEAYSQQERLKEEKKE